MCNFLSQDQEIFSPVVVLERMTLSFWLSQNTLMKSISCPCKTPSHGLCVLEAASNKQNDPLVLVEGILGCRPENVEYRPYLTKNRGASNS